MASIEALSLLHCYSFIKQLEMVIYNNLYHAAIIIFYWF